MVYECRSMKYSNYNSHVFQVPILDQKQVESLGNQDSLEAAMMVQNLLVQNFVRVGAGANITFPFGAARKVTR